MWGIKGRAGALGACVAAVAVGAGCEYNAPPEVSLELQADGTIPSGEPISMLFSEPIEAGSLALRLLPAERDIEKELVPGVEPVLGRCDVASSPCEGAALAVADDGMSATLTLPDGLAPLGSPLVLEVAAGLSDRDGAAWTIPVLRDFQISPSGGGNGEPVAFEPGHYVLLAETTQPIPAVIRIIADIKVLEDGTFRLAGGKGKPLDGKPRNTINPDEFTLDTGEEGFGVFVSGQMTSQDGQRFLETEPFEVDLVVLGIPLEMTGLQLTGTASKDPDTGMDALDGTLSFEKLLIYFGATPTEFGRDQVPPVPFVARRIPDEKVSEGAPEVCADDPCGAVTAQCAPPEGFPGDGICP